MFRTLSLTAALCGAAVQAWADNADFVLVNSTGYPISEVYVAPANVDAWGNDVMGKHTMQHGQAWKISFPRSNDECVYDMQVVFEDDNSKVTWKSLNLCEISKLTLTYDRKTGVTTAAKE